jgi:hypothetical protein
MFKNNNNLQKFRNKYQFNLYKHFNNDLLNQYQKKTLIIDDILFRYFNKNPKYYDYFYYFYLYKYYFLLNMYYSGNNNKNKFDYDLLHIKLKDKILSYLPINLNFLTNYELIYKINQKYKIPSNIIEISTNPIFYEIFNYFSLNFNLFSDINYTVNYSNLNFFNWTKDKWLKYIDNNILNFQKINESYIFDYTPLFTNLNKKYDFMIINLTTKKYIFENFILNEFYHNLPNILLQLKYIDYINHNGSCLFYIHSLYSNEALEIYYDLSTKFKNIKIFGRSELTIRKNLGGVWLYCTYKGNYNPSFNSIKHNILKWNIKEDKIKYIYFINILNFIKKHHNKKIDLVKIRKQQLKASYEWAKKYNFAILPIYDPVLPESFQKNFDEYFNINQSQIICKINLLTHLKKIQQIKQKLDFQINILNRFESIYDSIYQSILSFKSYLFSPLSLNPSNLVYFIEQNYNIPFINNSWLQYFELFSSAPFLFISKVYKDLISLHINELPGFSISSLFYYLQIFHKNINWNWKSLSSNSNNIKNDLFGYYKKYKNNFLSSNLSKKSKFNFINIEYNKNNITSKLLNKIIKNNLVFNGNAVLHFYLEKIEDLNEDIYQLIYHFSMNFKNIQIFRSQWALTKNSFFIIGIHKLKNKSKKINFDNFKNHIHLCLFNIFNQYQFEIEKYYFIYQNEKNFNKKNIKLIENNMIQRNKKWCDKMKLNKIHTFF